MFGFGKGPAGDDSYRMASGIASMLEAYAAQNGVAKLLDPTCRVVLLDNGKIALCFGEELLRGALASATTADKKDLQGLEAMVRNSPDPVTTEALFESMAPMVFDLVAKEILGRLQRGGHDAAIKVAPNQRDYSTELQAVTDAYDRGDLEEVEYRVRRASIIGERALEDATKYGFDEAHARADIEYDDGDMDGVDYAAYRRALYIGEIVAFINHAVSERKGI